MADSAAAATKPSSSVKLVLLGEAAVGKVQSFPLSFLGPPVGLLGKADIVLLKPSVFPRTPFREQPLPRKQGTHHRRYVPVSTGSLRRGSS